MNVSIIINLSQFESLKDKNIWNKMNQTACFYEGLLLSTCKANRAV